MFSAVDELLNLEQVLAVVTSDSLAFSAPFHLLLYSTFISKSYSLEDYRNLFHRIFFWGYFIAMAILNVVDICLWIPCVGTIFTSMMKSTSTIETLAPQEKKALSMVYTKIPFVRMPHVRAHLSTGHPCEGGGGGGEKNSNPDWTLTTPILIGTVVCSSSSFIKLCSWKTRCVL